MCVCAAVPGMPYFIVDRRFLFMHVLVLFKKVSLATLGLYRCREVNDHMYVREKNLWDVN